MPHSTRARKNAYAKRYYERVGRELITERRLLLNDYKTCSGCKDCGEKDSVVLQFHHRDPKSKVLNVAALITNRASLDRIFAEVAKCDVLCANCHLRRHGGNFRKELI